MKQIALYAALSIICSATLVAQWTLAGLEGRNIRELAAGENVLFAVTADSGSLHRSTNGGTTWEPLLRRGVHDVAVSPPGSVFKTMSDAIFRSTNNGQTWSRSLRCPAPSTIDVSPSGTLFLNISIPEALPGEHSHALFVSTNDGLTWVRRFHSDSSLCLGGECMAFFGPYSIIGDVCPDHHGFFISTDDGATWGDLHTPACFPTALGVSSQGILSSCQDGLNFSSDACENWTCKSTIIPTSFLTLPYSGVIAGTSDRGLAHFTDGGDLMGLLVSGLEGRSVGVLSLDSLRHVYAATDNGVYRTDYFDMRLSSDRIDMGTILIQADHQVDITIYNTGAGPLMFDSAIVDNDDIALEGIRDVIPEGDSCVLTVHCVPTTVGPTIWGATIAFVGEHIGREIEIAGTVYVLNEQHLNNRWNMISLPLLPFDPTSRTNYPGALTPAYAYDVDYQEQDTLVGGKGYWIKVASDTHYVLMGLPVGLDSVDVFVGWNMIGSLTVPIAVTDMLCDPPGMITSKFFGYEGVFLPSDTIYPGKGYWVKVNASGSLILSSLLPQPGTAARIRIVGDNELPPAPPRDNSYIEKLGPQSTSLAQNYPNPFNPITVIRYSLPVTGSVTVKVYDLLGREVLSLVDGMEEAGYRSVLLDATGLPSGVYYYRMTAGSFVETRRLIIIK